MANGVMGNKPIILYQTELEQKCHIHHFNKIINTYPYNKYYGELKWGDIGMPIIS